MKILAKILRAIGDFIGKNVAFIYLILITLLVFDLVLHFSPSQYDKGYEKGRIDLFKEIVFNNGL